MSQQKLRIQFRKVEDLRWISHRDLARCFERLFRRAEMPLAMSQGFHPHAKINFPSALSLGIEATGEWVEATLSETIDAALAEASLRQHAPPGLEIVSVALYPIDFPKPVVDWSTYQIDVPEDRQAKAQALIDKLLQQQHVVIQTARREVDVRAGLINLELDQHRLRFSLRALRTAQAGPRDVLQALELDDLEQHGMRLIRTHVHLKEHN